MIISFAGPFSWEGAVDAPCVYDVPESRESGVHLSTVPLHNGYLIHYVGETGVSFGARLRQTHSEYVAAMYHVYSPTEFARGEKVPLWPGYWGDEHGANRKSKEDYRVPRSGLVQEFLCCPPHKISYVHSGPSGSVETGKQSMVSMNRMLRDVASVFFGIAFLYRL